MLFLYVNLMYLFLQNILYVCYGNIMRDGKKLENKRYNTNCVFAATNGSARIRKYVVK